MAERVAALIPGAALVRLPSAAHSVIDFRERAASEVIAAVLRGEYARLPQRSAELDTLPESLVVRLLVWLIGAAAAVESALPICAYFAKPTLV